MMQTHPVEFAGCELRIVGLVNPLISEKPANLVHPIQASDHQLLEVELWGNAQEELHVQLIVVSHEWASSGSTRYHVQDRRFNLQVHIPACYGREDVASIDVIADMGSRT